MPFRNDIRLTPVPGCVDGWVELVDRYGTFSLGELLEPARKVADEGFAATGMLARAVRERLKGVPGAEDLWNVDVDEGGPVAGSILRRPGVARTFAAIAEEGRDGFYRGEFGRGLIRMGGGEYTEADLNTSQAEWVEPLYLNVFGLRLWTAPANSQGYMALAGLKAIERLNDKGWLPENPGSGQWAHLTSEAARVVGSDRSDVLFDDSDVQSVLDDAVARAELISPHGRVDVPDAQAAGGTTALAVCDRDGMSVSYIQSNAAGFGSHLFEPTTGIGLQNRGVGFNLVPGHPGEYRPGKRPAHTLVPFLATDSNNDLRLIATTMGGDSQPQILMQLVTRVLLHGQSPAQAMWEPRWRLHPGETGFDTWNQARYSPGSGQDAESNGRKEFDVDLESGAALDWASELRRCGHRCLEADAGSAFGHAHVIAMEEDRPVGAADPRSETGTVYAAS